MRLDAGSVDAAVALAGGAALGLVLKHIKEQLRSVPEKGLHYGLLWIQGGAWIRFRDRPGLRRCERLRDAVEHFYVASLRHSQPEQHPHRH